MADGDALLEPIEPEPAPETEAAPGPAEHPAGAEPRRTPSVVHVVRRHPLVAGATVLIGLVLVTAVVAAQVVHGSGTAAGNTLSEAFARTVRARSARVTVTITAVGGTEDEEAQETSIDGIVGFEPVRGTVTVRASAPAMAPAPLSSTMILTPDALFTRTDAATAQFHGGRHWLRSDRTGDRVPGPFTAATSGATTRRPPAGDAAAVHRVGAEKIDGAPVTHYVSRLATPAPGHPAIQLDVWVDGQGRVRRIHQVTPTSGSGRFEIDLDYRDFGVAVPDASPPASDIVDPTARQAPSIDAA